MAAGQSQKEFFVNEAHSLADMLLHPVIEGEANDPPATPTDGECWLVGSTPTGDWVSQAGDIACNQGGTWVFVTPQDGLVLFDKTSGQSRRYLGGWISATGVTDPTGGTIVDAEARTAITELVAALVAAGILPTV